MLELGNIKGALEQVVNLLNNTNQRLERGFADMTSVLTHVVKDGVSTQRNELAAMGIIGYDDKL